jgi:hypothetical protein
VHAAERGGGEGIKGRRLLATLRDQEDTAL